jgi:septal ring factor EnvC (AmiA/AmiB activator)
MPKLSGLREKFKMDLSAIFDWIRPPEPPEGASPAELAKYRNAVNRYRWNVSLTLVGVVAVLSWSVTPWGFALASDVDKKVAAAIDPFNRKLQELSGKLDDNARETQQLQQAVQSLTISSLEAKLVDTQIRKCRADSDSAREYFRGLVLEYERQYEAIRHTRFNTPACKDL